jgi:hypothetical protein
MVGMALIAAAPLTPSPADSAVGWVMVLQATCPLDGIGQTTLPYKFLIKITRRAAIDPVSETFKRSALNTHPIA